jgi:predicted  nucleic acid-binding Zn-ribbon protein
MNCIECGKVFTPYKGDQQFCCIQHSNKYHQRKFRDSQEQKFEAMRNAAPAGMADLINENAALLKEIKKLNAEIKRLRAEIMPDLFATKEEAPAMQEKFNDYIKETFKDYTPEQVETIRTFGVRFFHDVFGAGRKGRGKGGVK